MDLITTRLQDDTWRPWDSRPRTPAKLSPAVQALADRAARTDRQETEMTRIPRVLDASDPRHEGYRSGGAAPKPASEKSLGYLHSLQDQAAKLFIQLWTLQAEHGATEGVREAAASLLVAVKDNPVYTPVPAERGQREVSRLIDTTKQAIEQVKREIAAITPKAAPAQRAERGPAEAGFYVVEDGPLAGIYKVQIAVHGSGRPYAKKLVTEGPEAGSWEFARGMQYKLTPDQTLTREKAARYGELYGMCVRCGANLTDEDSISRYMGPVCYAKTGA